MTKKQKDSGSMKECQKKGWFFFSIQNSKSKFERVKRFKGVQSLCSMFDGASLIWLQQHKDPTLSIVSEPVAGQLLRIHKLAC